jgi:hypothetical protein
MKKEEIIKGNKLIAEFDGRVNKMCHDNTTASPYNYHTAWDWLMPVVEKIESLGYTVTIAGVLCKVHRVLDMDNPMVSWVLGDKTRKKELVYTTVTDFIKWYNKNNQ